MKKVKQRRKNGFWENIIVYFPLMRHGPYRKQKNYEEGKETYRRVDSKVISYATVYFFKIRKLC
jgi:hypothetical protein